ncbi:MAG TPA: glycoside hydrolase family 5 protein [Labilithrix sp.]|nr:glycoside hydrolase family 5 protein [Labilithrix sp.]
MKQVRKGGIAKYTCALVILPTAVACGSSADTETTTERRAPTTKGAELPNDTAGDTTTNPQRSPEQWTRPDSAPASPEDESAPAPSAPPASDPGAPAAPADPGAAPAEEMSGPVPFRGINLAGAEFGSALPGAFGTDYTFPTRSEVDYYVGKGMNTFRVGFKWERLQHSANGDLDATYLGRLDAIVTYATSKGATVILNPHNFARYYGTTVGSSKVPNGVFADLWKRLAAKYKANAKVMFNLVNEPHDMGTEQWVGAANAAIAAIRAEGANNAIIVPGNGWTGAHSWTSTYYGTPNSKAMLAIEDSKNNHLFEVHQYMDSDSSGGSGECVSTTVGSERLAAFVKWLRDNKKKGFLGEFAGGNNSTCNAAVKNMLDFVHESSDVLVGWTWWAGGPWWGEYKFALDPTSGGKDRPQMALLTPFLKK